jgi:hypothetical protein
MRCSGNDRYNQIKELLDNSTKTFVIKQRDGMKYLSQDSFILNGTIMCEIFTESIDKALIVNKMATGDFLELMRSCADKGLDIYEVTCKPILIRRVE